MTANSPTISVIMPCYNAEQVIASTINHLYQQTFKNFEVVVIDDGSSDDTFHQLNELTKQFNSLRVFSQTNQGPSAARNHGLKVARGDFIAFLDSDDTWHPELLSRLYGALIQSPDAVLSYCGWQNIGLAPNQSKPYVPPDYESANKLEQLIRVCPWPIHAALTKKTAIDKVNGFNPKWFTSEDFDMWLRIASFNKIIRVNAVLAYYHHNQGKQISVNSKRAAINHWMVQKAFLKDFPYVSKIIGKSRLTQLTDGELLKRAYESFWANDLATAHFLFRKILATGSFGLRDIRYIFPAILPIFLYQYLVNILRK